LEEERLSELKKMAEYILRLLEERKKQPPKFDLLSMLAHGESTRDTPSMEFIGNLVLLIVGGNDTMRNTMTGGLMALNQFPHEYRKLMANPGLVESAVSEIIRLGDTGDPHVPHGVAECGACWPADRGRRQVSDVIRLRHS